MYTRNKPFLFDNRVSETHQFAIPMSADATSFTISMTKMVMKMMFSVLIDDDEVNGGGDRDRYNNNNNNSSNNNNNKDNSKLIIIIITITA